MCVFIFFELRWVDWGTSFRLCICNLLIDNPHIYIGQQFTQKEANFVESNGNKRYVQLTS